MQILPGFGVFDSPELPKAPPPPPPPPKRDDPSIAAARERQLEAEKKRKGRSSTILTSGTGVEGGLGSVSRPTARPATLLGGT